MIAGLGQAPMEMVLRARGVHQIGGVVILDPDAFGQQEWFDWTSSEPQSVMVSQNSVCAQEWEVPLGSNQMTTSEQTTKY